jgi:ipoprotein LpqH
LANSVSALPAKLHTAETVHQRRWAATTTKENRVKRSVAVAAAATAIVVVGLSGCSSTSTPGQKVSTGGHAKVVVDGKDQNAQGPVTCQQAGGALQIGIGQGQGAIAVQGTDGNPPNVQQIALGTVNGVTLAYQQGSPGASVQATKNGSDYKFTGTATGMDPANAAAGLVSKSFEVDVTCP